MKISSLWVALAACLSASLTAAKRLTPEAQSLFDASMAVQDLRWDDTYKAVWFNDKGSFSNRFTSWYIPGPFQRNKAGDHKKAIDALDRLLLSQTNEDFDSPWYGTFKLSPDEPVPTADSPLYPPSIYETYDPNWREFVGVQFVQILAEFEPRLPKKLVKRMEYSLEKVSIGAMRRNGTYPDNLTIAYSNPALLRALLVGWTGHHLGQYELTDFTNEQENMIYELFTRNGANVFSEYNAPTYYGIDIFATLEEPSTRKVESRLPLSRIMFQPDRSDLAMITVGHGQAH